MSVTIKRIIKSGWLSFVRNRLLSMAAILVITIALLVTVSLTFFNYTVQIITASLRDKVDVTVYFNSDTSEERILRIQKSLAMLEDVKNIEYISRESALINFKEKHKDNSILLRSLEELNDNPLQPSLNIKTYTASQYGAITSFLESSVYKSAIDKINYKQNENLINRFASLVKNTGRFAVGLTIVLSLMAILVTFNTIRLAIYNWRNEIGVMKLVGASNWYVRGPFLIEGIFYGIISALISMAIIYPLIYFFSPKLLNFVADVNLWQFLNANIVKILLLQFGVGIGLGVISSLIAIRKHLNV